MSKQDVLDLMIKIKIRADHFQESGDTQNYELDQKILDFLSNHVAKHKSRKQKLEGMLGQLIDVNK